MQKEPFELGGIKKVRPRYVTKRLEVQAGIFTIHNPPNLCLDEVSPRGALRKIVIDKSYVDDLRKELSLYGVNERTLFPDLDGLARHMT
jgi:hypothetical protein